MKTAMRIMMALAAIGLFPALALAAPCPGKKEVRKARTEAAFRALDRNNDGKISVCEFHHRYGKFTDIDENADRFIDLTEWRQEARAPRG